MMLKHWTFQCRGTSKRCCKNASIKSPQNRNIVLIPHPQNNMAQRQRNITLSTVVVDCRPQKADPHRIQITAGRYLINYPGELSTHTTDITTSKSMWNSVLSTEGAKYMCLDLKNFHLSAPLD
jgi:hypothetical protein